MEDKEKWIRGIMKQVEKLPVEAQRAICWSIQNLDLMEEMSAGEKLSEAEMAQLTQRAFERKDYIMLAILLYKQRKDMDETEREQRES